MELVATVVVDVVDVDVAAAVAFPVVVCCCLELFSAVVRIGERSVSVAAV